jgi:putative MATE family efflux protein
MQDRPGKDLTQGNMLANIISFSLPMLLGNILQAANTALDSMWVGRFLGPEALGAVAVTFPITFLLISLVMGIAMAATVLVSQYAGAQNSPMIKKAIINSFLLLAITGVLVSLLGIVFNRPVLRMINTPEEIIPIASNYLVILLGGLIFMFGYNGVSAIQRGLGDAKTPLYFLAISVVINIILDPLLILGVWFFPKMGVNGAALATVISQIFAFIAAFIYLFKKTNLIRFKINELAFDQEVTMKILKIGLPTGVQATVISMGGMFLGSIINSFGTHVVAAYGIASNLDKLAITFAMSIAAATTTITGQNIGARKEENLKAIIRSSWLLVIGVGLFFTLLALFIPRLILGLFTNDGNVLSIGEQYLRIMAMSYIPFSVGYVTNGALRGAGDAFPTMIFTIIALWGVRVPLAKILSIMMGVNGIWLAIAISAIIGMLLSTIYYATGRWKKQ